MGDNLNKVRQFFPAEVTAAYLAILGIVESKGVGESEAHWQMFTLVLVLIFVNACIYTKFKGLKPNSFKSLFYHVMLAVGFFFWVLNIDMARFKDIPIIGPDVELVAPISLVLYTLITSFIAFPKQIQNENENQVT